MTRYIRLDAHSESCTIVVMGPSGKRLKEELLETNIAASKQFVRTIPKPRHLCLEEGTLSEWLYEELSRFRMETRRGSRAAIKVSPGSRNSRAVPKLAGQSTLAGPLAVAVACWT
jgi:hypothetical protein